MHFFIPDEPGRSHAISTPGGGFCLVFEFATQDDRKPIKPIKPLIVDPKKPRLRFQPVLDGLRRRYRIQAHRR